MSTKFGFVKANHLDKGRKGDYREGYHDSPFSKFPGLMFPGPSKNRKLKTEKKIKGVASSA